MNKTLELAEDAIYVGGAHVCRECGVMWGYVHHPCDEYRREHKPGCKLGKLLKTLDK